jgi:hypothetical protein
MLRRMLAKLTNLETRQNDLDGKVLDMLDKTQANNATLDDIKVMFSKKNWKS